MRKVVRRAADLIYRALGSDKFFILVLCLLVFQAVWLAFTAIYPLPFDEYAHVGAIQLYAKQWSWVVTWQPFSSGLIGDLTREPSFLYRWLMSFPFRLFDSFLSFNQTVVALRLINVAMVVGGTWLFRKLLREWDLSKRIIHIVLLAFVMTPIVPFLAAHINYDNMMFLLTPITLMYATRLIKGNGRLIQNAAMLVLTGTIAVLVKQTFLPIMGIITLYIVVVVAWRNRGKYSAVLTKSWRETPKNFVFYLVIIGLICVSVMATERYGRNIVRYGALAPPCEIVQPREFCSQFGPWYRNKIINVKNRPASPPYGNPFSFSQYWLTRMTRGYFAIFQHTPTKAVSAREPYGPIVIRPLLPLPVNFAVIIAVLGAVAVIWQRRKIWRNWYLRFSLVLVMGFIIVQWGYNYRSYQRMWKAEAIQARYTFPLMILMFLLLAWSVNQLIKNRQAKAYLAMAMIVFYVWGGGIAGWLIRADDSWRWQNQTIQTVNHTVQNVLKFTVIH